MNPFHLDLCHLPSSGKKLVGTLPASFFGLAPEDPLRAEGPLTFDLQIARDGDDLTIEGSLKADFSLECGRCLERFPHQILLSPYFSEIEIENEGILDLTDQLREDILLALPNFPRCEDGNISPRVCPAEGRFDQVEQPSLTEEPTSNRGVWDALDQLKN